MQKLFKKIATLAMAATLSIGVSANVSTTFAQETSAAENTLVISTEKNGPSGNNYEYIWWNRGELYQVLTFRSLFLANNTFTEFEPDLVESYETTEDGLKYTFIMKDGLKWSDGEDLTAEDVAFSIKTGLRAGQINALYTSAFTKIEGAEEWQNGDSEELTGLTVNGNTIEITLTSPVGNLIGVLSQFAILPNHILADVDPLTINQDEFWTNPVTSGMYAVEEVNTDNYITLTVNEFYEKDKPKIATIVVKQLDDEITAALAGETSYTYSRDVAAFDQLSADENWGAFPVDSLYYQYMIMNIEGTDGNKNDTFADKKVREALLYAIDRETLVDTMFGDLGIVNNAGVPMSDETNYNADNNTYAYDPEKAKQLLDEAGWDYNKIIRFRGGSGNADIFNAIIGYLDQIGIKAEFTEFSGDLTTELFDVRDYDATMKGLAAFSYEEWYGEYTNNANFQNIIGEAPEFTDLNTELIGEADPAGRAEILKELQQTEQDTLYKLPMYMLKYTIYVDTARVNIGDTQFGNPKYAYDLNFENWSLVE